MDTERQSWARSAVVSQFGSAVLGPLRMFGNGTAEHCPRNYVKILDGAALSSDCPNALASDLLPLVDACTAIFADLLKSADRFIALAYSSLYNLLLLYGEFSEQLSDRSGVELFTDFLPHLRDFDFFLRQCEQLASFILRQLRALFALSLSNDVGSAIHQPEQLSSSPILTNWARELPLERVWRCLGDLLSLFIVFDEVIGRHPFLRPHWAQFVRSVRLAQHNSSQFSMCRQSDRLQQLDAEIIRLDAELMSGNIFRNICHRLVSCLGHLHPQRRSLPQSASSDERAFVDRFRRIIMDSLARWERLAAVDDMIPDKQHLLALLALAQLFHILLAEINKNQNNKRKTIDRKMIRALYSTHKRVGRMGQIISNCHRVYYVPFLVVAFYLVGDILFTPTEHIASAFDPIDAGAIERKARASAAQARAALLEHQIEQMQRQAHTLKLCVTEWCHKMDQFEFFPPTNGAPIEELVERKCNLLLDGAHISDRIGRLLKCILNGHFEINRPLSKQNARLLFELVQNVKRISSTFDLHWTSVLEWAQFGCANASSALLRLLDAQVVSLASAGDGRYDGNAFAVAALRNAQLALAQMVTKNSIVHCGVALEMANYSKLFRPLDVQRVDDYLVRLGMFSDFAALLRRITDFSFLYWHRQFLCETFCNFLLNEPTVVTECDLASIKHFFDALNDSTNHFLQNEVLSAQQTFLHSFGNEMFAIFKQKFLDVLCTQIENDLRLSYHSQRNASLASLGCLLSDGIASSEGSGGVDSSHFWHNLQRGEKQRHPCDSTTATTITTGPSAVQVALTLLHLPTFQMGNKLINVKAFVTCHLESVFYNLSVLALHDCDSYRRMAFLAHHRYHLSLADSGLPNMNVDQGLDLVTVMANVDTFVADYCYNLNEQFFIEHISRGKAHLNILRVHQVVNSLKTHGLGILNTLVNSAYKFLRLQFQRLSRCLFDERIKRLLTQEILFYRDSMDALDQMYPMSHAEKLVNVLHRFDSHSSSTTRAENAITGGANCLDHLRVLITQMGNLLGLLRLIRTGIVEFCSPVIFSNFIPVDSVRPEHKTTHLPKDAKTEHVVEEACHLYGRALKNALSNLMESRDCVALLTSIFSDEFRCNGQKRHSHLRHFFVAVPALMLCHVEHTMRCRAHLLTSTRREATTMKDQREKQQQMVFVEDGFSMGIAYVLTLFNQRFFFDSLNWCNSVKRFFRSELSECAAEINEAQKRKDESLVRVLAVKKAQLEERRAEHRLLMCTLNSALTLFQANELFGEEENDETFLDDL